MTLLSDRVQKSKSLKFNFIPGTTKIAYGTVSPDSGFHYQVFMMKTRGTSIVDEECILHDIITTECHCNTGNGRVVDCKGNSKHTICYHCLGAIRCHLALKNCKIAFCENIIDAIQLRKLEGSQTLVKIVSGQDGGKLWGVVGEKRQCVSCGIELKSKNNKIDYCSGCAMEELSQEERVNILHGTPEELVGEKSQKRTDLDFALESMTLDEVTRNDSLLSEMDFTERVNILRGPVEEQNGVD